MSVEYCHDCGSHIDTDFDVDHEWECLHADCDHDEDEECPNA